MLAVLKMHIDYQRAIRAYVNKIDDFPKPRKDKNKEPQVSKLMKDHEW